MNNKDFQNGLIIGAASGIIKIIDTTEIDSLEILIDESGVFENDELTLVEKVRHLINIAKNSITKNFLKSSDGFILKDVNRIYLMPKESD